MHPLVQEKLLRLHVLVFVLVYVRVCVSVFVGGGRGEESQNHLLTLVECSRQSSCSSIF